MPDDLEKFLADQAAAEEAELGAELEKHIERRKLRGRRIEAPGRDRKTVVDELEAGSDELIAMDDALQKQQNGPQK
jgi:GTPase involved in cell partitioning and DNA repair